MREREARPNTQVKKRKLLISHIPQEEIEVKTVSGHHRPQPGKGVPVRCHEVGVRLKRNAKDAVQPSKTRVGGAAGNTGSSSFRRPVEGNP